MLSQPRVVECLQMGMDDFDPSAASEAVTPANLGAAVLLGARHRLLAVREGAFEALCRGFTRCEDLQIQLAAFGPPRSLALVLQGSQSLSAAELLECFTLPRESEAEGAAAGFADAGSAVPEFFERLLRDEAAFGQKQRLQLLQWCTALSALPAGGLRDARISLRLYGPEQDDETLPETHTCTREIHLPNYSSIEVLRQKLFLALQHVDDGFQNK